MLKSIQSITYVKEGAFVKPEYFKLEIQNNILKYTDQDGKPVVKNINDRVLIGYVDKIMKIADTWEKEYKNNLSVDGACWKVFINFNNGDKRQYIGKNKYPSNFIYFNRLINKLKKEEGEI